MFALPRSSWQDYDKSKLSTGGVIVSRSQKSVVLPAEAAAAIGLAKTIASPAEIMNAILKAPADLLWFGGIGTYVRASGETNQEVGDRANDAIRVTAAEVRAKVIGEGANLGVTQRARIEFGLRRRCLQFRRDRQFRRRQFLRRRGQHQDRAGLRHAQGQR